MPGKSLHRSIPLPTGQRLDVFEQELAPQWRCQWDDQDLLTVELTDGIARVEQHCQEPTQLLRAAWAFFVSQPDMEALQFESGFNAAFMIQEENQTARLERDMFWQLPGDWLSQGDALPYPVTMIMDASGRRHPRRRAKPAGEVYRRFDTGIQAWVSLRTLDIEEDLHRFMRWQNSERVAAFWEQSGTLEEHRAYLESQAKESRVLNLIGCIDDEPFAYFEAYWAKEDRIAPYYDAQDFDRGIHMLVGEDHHRGPHKVKAWLNALCHYLFLDDCRTTRIVSEPRSDNDRMIQHLQARRFAKPKEFDFPHKRAALMVLHRDAFFERCELS
ncbi:siderophore biosynthesis protein [Alcanivorax sp. HI0083]|uniref:GNAT family N-acetyltransferase n=1 Tax=unclassified Alcanivorax TaxID=2638842 RepID=UPI0007B99E9E|nr:MULTISPECIES: GNAT family N-acetyltransferase [unclassified Alcanivorax]KZY35091.1 siderophore biosynthesis protein [Alcanivorax sp. HI0044]KZZ22867.1 siderophore biosynthesis protein [Alcanivorax sp. HI0083]